MHHGVAEPHDDLHLTLQHIQPLFGGTAEQRHGADVGQRSFGRQRAAILLLRQKNGAAEIALAAIDGNELGLRPGDDGRGEGAASRTTSTSTST